MKFEMLSYICWIMLGSMLGSCWDNFDKLVRLICYIFKNKLTYCGDKFGVMMRSVWDGFGIVLRSCWDRFGMVLGSCWDRLGIVLGSCWDHLGIIWRQFGIISESFWVVWNHFGIPFGNLFFPLGGAPPVGPRQNFAPA